MYSKKNLIEQLSQNQMQQNIEKKINKNETKNEEMKNVLQNIFDLSALPTQFSNIPIETNNLLETNKNFTTDKNLQQTFNQEILQKNEDQTTQSVITSTATLLYESKKPSEVNPSPKELWMRGINIPVENVLLQNPWQQKSKTGTFAKLNHGFSFENSEEKFSQEIIYTTPKSAIENLEESQILKWLLKKYGANVT